jgi:hypothetical protein
VESLSIGTRRREENGIGGRDEKRLEEKRREEKRREEERREEKRREEKRTKRREEKRREEMRRRDRDRDSERPTHTLRDNTSPHYFFFRSQRSAPLCAAVRPAVDPAGLPCI